MVFDNTSLWAITFLIWETGISSYELDDTATWDCCWTWLVCDCLLLLRKSTTSALIILPLGPVPLTDFRSTPDSIEVFLASGLTNILFPCWGAEVTFVSTFVSGFLSALTSAEGDGDGEGEAALTPTVKLENAAISDFSSTVTTIA